MADPKASIGTDFWQLLYAVTLAEPWAPVERLHTKYSSDRQSTCLRFTDRRVLLSTG